MSRLRIVRIRREYNQWVANETLEDYSLRFTARAARRWSSARVANTALGSISFLALEAIGAAITLSFGVQNAVAAILATSLLIFLVGLPVAVSAARHGVDIDLLTRGAGFGYIGSTVTSLVYASFTFIFFAIEAAIMAAALELCLGLPLPLGYVVCSLAIIPLATHGITFISRLQRWTQPVWVVLQILPFAFIAASGPSLLDEWTGFPGLPPRPGGFDLVGFGAAASVVFALVAQIGEQVDFLRFLPAEPPGRRRRWWASLLAAGPGWAVIGAAKMLAGSFLAVLALGAGLSPEQAAQPTELYRLAFGYVLPAPAWPPAWPLALAAVFVVVCQVKINVTNAYAGSLAWSNFFSRLTHRHPGRVVWLVFNVAIALLLMELGIYQAIEQVLSLYSVAAAAWMGALVADLVVNKPLGLSPAGIEFKRAHLHGFNPVGVGSVLLAVLAAAAAHTGALGGTARAFTPFVAFAAAFASAPAIAGATGGRFYLARRPRRAWAGAGPRRCVVCENPFEPEDMAHCPAYAGAICSLCCSLDARCHDGCKPRRPAAPASALLAWTPGSVAWRYAGAFLLFAGAIGAVLAATALQAGLERPEAAGIIAAASWRSFLVLLVVVGVAAWVFVLAQDNQRAAQDESRHQTALLLDEISAHERTDAALQAAKEAAEAANLAKSRYVVGISHEVRTPLNAIMGYAQLLDRDPAIPERRREAVRVIRRSGEHMVGLIDGLLDIAKIEAGRIEVYRDEVRIREFLDQLAAMFRLQCEARGLRFVFTTTGPMPAVVYTDEKRLRQILINLLSNAVKFTGRGHVALHVCWRHEVAEFRVEDTGRGIADADLPLLFEPFQRIASPGAAPVPGIGLGLAITRLLAQIMGGDIQVESAPGRGSTFRVRLMLSAVARPAIPAAPAPDALGYEGTRRAVMVVDDDPDHRALMRDVLAPLGFSVALAPDGPDCLARADALRPDLFLIDLSMPGMGGWELARRLREAGHERAAIIVVSANAGELRPGPAQPACHDDALAKPVDLGALLERISRHLGLDWLPVAPLPAAGAAGGGLLTPAQLGGLRQLAEIGHVRGLTARLAELSREADDPALPRLQEFAAGIRLQEFTDLLDEVERRAPGGATPTGAGQLDPA